MKKIFLTLALSFAVLSGMAANSHPSLLLTAEGVKQIRNERGEVPMFDASLEEMFAGAERALAEPIVVPQPKDGGGGYSHETHKLNYYKMLDCGIAYQITGKKKYARYVIDMLEEYAELYPTLGFHPVELSGVPGRLFWQTLNESVWLVHTSMAYDCVYDALNEDERARIEKNLFHPIADFIMNGMDGNTSNNKTFNKMHNHGTWATAAVGMIGMVMGDDNLTDQALYGSDKTGKNGGYVQQLSELFSPDGYFTEGAYYLRYAIWPFVLFAQSIDHNRPELKIFEHRDGILLKAVNSLVQSAYDGQFFRFNDALEKGYNAQELIYAIDIAYNADPSNKSLLDVAARYQHKVLPSDAGFRVARDIERGEAEKVALVSTLYRDGRDGEQGGVAIIRNTDPELNTALTLKATSHGLSHGHYDKLTMAYYDNDHEILTDYGAARFINIEAKYKGHYTKQNTSFARKTIAHNTLSVDGRTHFDGNYKESSKYHSDILFADFDAKNVQIVSAEDNNAYAKAGVGMQRTLAYVTTDFLAYPLVFDIFRATSDKEHTYELPYYYGGHMVSLNFPYEKALNTVSTLGDKHGYEHLWLEAWGSNADSETSTFTWYNKDRFYSLSTATTPQSQMKMVVVGANDPDYNLRREPAYILTENAKNHTFASVLETHGYYNLQVEQSADLTASCIGVEVLVDTKEYTVVRANFKQEKSVVLCIANASKSDRERHKAGGYSWRGDYKVVVE